MGLAPPHYTVPVHTQGSLNHSRSRDHRESAGRFLEELGPNHLYRKPDPSFKEEEGG